MRVSGRINYTEAFDRHFKYDAKKAKNNAKKACNYDKKLVALHVTKKEKLMIYDYQKLSVEKFTKLKKDKKIKLDPSFQVGTDESSRWDKLQQSKYIRSVLLGSAPSPFTVVNCELAYQNNCDRGTDNQSIEYFDGLRNDYQWLSIDGNNRSIALRNFVDGEIKIPAGVYILKNGSSVKIKRGMYDTFDTMAPALKSQFLSDEVLVIEYSDILWRELGVLFRNINDGYPLNGQQKRQSFPSPIADYVRNMREKFESSLSNFISPKPMRNLGGDEFIAKCMSFVVNSGLNGQKELNDMYESPKVAASIVKPLSKNISQFTSVIQNVLKDLKVGVGSLSKSTNSVFDYFVINWNLRERNIRVVDRKEFYNTWLDITSEFFLDEVTTYDLSSIETKSSQIVYKDIVKKITLNYGEWRRQLVMDTMLPDLLESGVLVQTSDDDYYTPNEKKIMWKRQNGICPCNREDCVREIPLSEICDGTKWHGDAIDPRANGGEHTLENGQLMCRVGNQKKSKSIGVSI